MTHTMEQHTPIITVADLEDFMGSHNPVIVRGKAHDLFMEPWDAFSALLEDLTGKFMTVIMSIVSGTIKKVKKELFIIFSTWA
jgi:hypothetical protein